MIILSAPQEMNELNYSWYHRSTSHFQTGSCWSNSRIWTLTTDFLTGMTSSFSIGLAPERKTTHQLLQLTSKPLSNRHSSSIPITSSKMEEHPLLLTSATFWVIRTPTLPLVFPLPRMLSMSRSNKRRSKSRIIGQSKSSTPSGIARRCRTRCSVPSLICCRISVEIVPSRN